MALVILDIFGIFGFFSDMSFIIKIFAFVAILGFVNKYIQNKLIKILMVVFMGYFILIASWSTFGPVFIIYTLLGIGVAGTMVDLFFVGQQVTGEKQAEQQGKQQNLTAPGTTPLSSGVDVAQRRMNSQTVKNPGMNPFMRR